MTLILGSITFFRQ